jgi:hypothetical protein
MRCKTPLIALLLLLLLALFCCGEDATAPEDNGGNGTPDPCPDPAGNTPPEIAAVSDTTTALGDTLRVPLNVSDIDGDELTYYIETLDLTITEIMKGLFPTVSIDTLNVEFVFVPESYDQPDRDFRVAVEDPCGERDSTDFSVTITD